MMMSRQSPIATPASVHSDSGVGRVVCCGAGITAPP